MDKIQAIKQRHSVRAYTDKSIPEDIVDILSGEVEKINAESGLNIQFLTEEPEAFDSLLAHYGRFENVKNYFALVGKKGDDTDEKVGYYGERLVILSQTLGLNTCWVALTFSRKKAKVKVEEGESLVVVISLGYGKTQGTMHKSKSADKVSDLKEGDPEWYKRGVECALLAPTAINQQKFFIKRNGNAVSIAATGGGKMGRVDLGIVKHDFEVGAGKENFVWAE